MFAIRDPQGSNKDPLYLLFGLLILFLLVALLAASLAASLASHGPPSSAKYGGQDVPKLRAFYRSIANPKGAQIVGLHYASWCPYCRIMEPEWAALEAAMATNGEYLLKKIDRDKYKDCGATTVPLIAKYDPQSDSLDIYQGPRTAEKIMAWIAPH